MRLTAITSTVKTARTLKGGAVIPVGTVYTSGVIVDTFDGAQAAMRMAASDELTLRIARSKDKAEKVALRKQLKEMESRGILRITGTGFLLLLSKCHPTVELDNDGKAALGRLLKGVQIVPELIAE